MPFFQNRLTKEQCQMFIQRILTKGEKLYGIYRDRTCIGYIHVYDIRGCSAEIGYRILSAYQNHGWMTQAMAMYLKNNPDCLTKVFARVKKENLPSLTVLEHNGFTKYEEIDNAYVYCYGDHDDRNTIWKK